MYARRIKTGLLGLFAMLMLSVMALFFSYHTVNAASMPVRHISGSLTVSQTWTASFVYVLDGQFTIPSGKTLTIAPGTIIKITTGAGIMVASGGTLNASGTSLSKITFTSIKDDSIVGDTGADGVTSGGPDDYLTAISNYGGKLTLKYANIRYGSNSLDIFCYNSLLPTSVTDSTISGRTQYSECIKGQVSFQRNIFSVNSWVTALTIYSSDVGGVVLSGTNQNIFSGTNKARVITIMADDYLSTGITWSVAGSSKAVLSVDHLPIYGTMNLQAGAVVKVAYSSNYFGLDVMQGGRLSVAGTAASPVLITSLRDDAVGGDSTGDGLSSGASGQYYGAIEQIEGAAGTTISNAVIKNGYYAVKVTGSRVDLSNATIVNMGTGIYMTGGESYISNTTLSNLKVGLDTSGGQAVVRGKFNGATVKVIRACEWSTSLCSVDAAYVDWGSVNGPFMANPVDNLVCGTTSFNPWVYKGIEYSNTVEDNYMNCGNGLTPRARVSTGVSYFNQRISAEKINCSAGFFDACQAMDTAYKCLSGAAQVAGSYYPLSDIALDPRKGTESAVVGSIVGGASQYVQSNEAKTFLGDFASFESKMFGAVGQMLGVADAYSQCAP